MQESFLIMSDAGSTQKNYHKINSFIITYLFEVISDRTEINFDLAPEPKYQKPCVVLSVTSERGVLQVPPH